MIRIEEHLPASYYAYKEVRYYRELCRAEDPEFEKELALSVRYLKNMAITEADSEGLSRYEAILNITPDPGDDLETRRIRVLARINMIEPFDLVYLHRFLAGLVGWENYEIDEESLPEGILHISVNTRSSRIFSVLYSELLGFVPCNLMITLTQIVEPDPAYCYPVGAATYGMTLNILPRTADVLEEATEISTGGAVTYGYNVEVYHNE